MEKLPYELIFSIALRLNSPRDLAACLQVSSLFRAVFRDDRLWKRLCLRCYPNHLPLGAHVDSYYDLFTKTLAPYGRYLGYWKSNKRHRGGLVQVTLNLPDGIVLGEEINAVDDGPQNIHFFFDDQADSPLEPSYPRSTLFTINVNTGEIFCHECNQRHGELPWRKTFDSDQPYFGLSQEALPEGERSSLLSRDAIDAENPEARDIYFIRNCQPDVPIVYRPLTVPEPKTSAGDHPLARYNGLWVGTYGSHGLEILHLECREQFSCPVTADGVATEVEVVPTALVATKIIGDPNVPHGKISFAAVRARPADQPEARPSYDGVGQIAQTNFVEPQFIVTRVMLSSESLLKVTWFALHHASSFLRCEL